MKQTLILIVAIGWMNLSFAQSEKLSDPSPYFAAIIVSNMDTSLQWYQEKLGFKVLNQVNMTDRGFRQANLQRGKALIELIELSAALHPKEILKSKSKKTRIGGFFKFGFTVKQFDKWLSHLQSCGAEFNGKVVVDKNSGKRMVIINDPDGNRIQLFEK